MGQRVFVTGATGVLGRRVVPHLVEAGHTVTAVVRSEAKADAVRSAGAIPVSVDLFDGDALRVALAGHDSIAQLATHIPTGSAAADPSAWRINDALRRDAAAAIADVATCSIHVDDAAAAVAAALDAPAGTYNVAEPDPARRSVHREALEAVAATALPVVEGGSVANPLARSHRISSRSLSDVSPWTPTIRCVDRWKELR